MCNTYQSVERRHLLSLNRALRSGVTTQDSIEVSLASCYYHMGPISVGSEDRSSLDESDESKIWIVQLDLAVQVDNPDVYTRQEFWGRPGTLRVQGRRLKVLEACLNFGREFCLMDGLTEAARPSSYTRICWSSS